MKFTLTVEYYRKLFRFEVERISKTSSLELFKVSAGDKEVVLQSNKPILQARGLKHKPIDWKVIQGKVTNNGALQVIINAIEKKVY